MKTSIIVVLLVSAGVVGMGWPVDPLGLRCRVAPDADLSAHPSTYAWQDITKDLALRHPITHDRGSEDEQAESNSESSFVLRNQTGRYTTDNPASDLWPKFGLNTPVEFATNTGDGSGWNVEWVQYLGDAVDRWPAATPQMCETHVTCNGLMRRLGQDDTTPESAHTRIVKRSATAPMAYWPLEDKAHATTAASPIAGVDPMSPITESNYKTTGNQLIPPGGAPNFGEGVGPAGSDRLANFRNGGTLLGVVPAGSVASEWSFEFVIKFDPDFTDSSPLSSDVAYVFAGGTYGAFLVNAFIGSPGFDSGIDITHRVDRTASASGRARAIFSPQDGTPHHIRYTVAQDGANYRAKIYLDGNLASTADNFGSPMVGTVGRPTTVELNPASQSGVFAPAALGQVTLWESETVPVDTAEAAFGHVGEQAHHRAARLCAEDNIPSDITATRSPVMGAQPVAVLPVLLRECETTGHALIDDSQGTIGFRSLEELCNQEPALTIDAAHRNELFMPFEPTTDDLQRRNKVTASRPNGGEYTVANLDDINGVPHTRPRIGTYPGNIEVNVASDEQLPNHAAWIAYGAGAQQGKRYPGVTIDLLRAPHLYRAASKLRTGDRVLVKNPPRQHARGDIDLIFVGWNRVVMGRRGANRLTANCVRYDPYRVGVYGTDAATVSRWDSADSRLVNGVSATATELLVATGQDHALWITGSSPPVFPVDVGIAGVRIPVSAIASAVADSFTRTVANEWDSTDTGQAYTVTGGVAADYFTNGAKGVLLLPTGDTASRNTTLPDIYGDVELTATLTCSAVATGGNLNGAIRWRHTDFSNHYRLTLVYETGGTIDAVIQKVLSGVTTSLATAANMVTYSAGSDTHVRIRMHGMSIWVKVWTGSAEPQAWSLFVTDASHATGQIGCRGLQSAGNTNVNPTISFDNLELVNPQTFTVQRFADGYDKLLPATARVRLWRPARYAL